MSLRNISQEEHKVVFTGFINLNNVSCCFYVYVCLFVILSCAKPPFLDKITLHTFFYLIIFFVLDVFKVFLTKPIFLIETKSTPLCT